MKKCKGPNAVNTEPNQSMLNYVTSGGQGGSLVPHIFSQKRCRRALVELIICDEMPFRSVEKHKFKAFVKESVELMAFKKLNEENEKARKTALFMFLVNWI